MFHDLSNSDDAVLDSIEAAHRAQFEEQFRDDRPHDITGIPPNSIARPGRLISNAEDELRETLEWLDALIESRFGPEQVNTARRSDDQYDDPAH